MVYVTLLHHQSDFVDVKLLQRRAALWSQLTLGWYLNLLLGKDRDLHCFETCCGASPLTVQAECRHAGGTVKHSVAVRQSLRVAKLWVKSCSRSFSSAVPTQDGKRWNESLEGKKKKEAKTSGSMCFRNCKRICVTLSSWRQPRPGLCRPRRGRTAARHWLEWSAVSASGLLSCLQKKF